jgi:hypothetical protein
MKQHKHKCHVAIKILLHTLHQDRKFMTKEEIKDVENAIRILKLTKEDEISESNILYKTEPPTFHQFLETNKKNELFTK